MLNVGNKPLLIVIMPNAIMQCRNTINLFTFWSIKGYICLSHSLSRHRQTFFLCFKLISIAQRMLIEADGDDDGVINFDEFCDALQKVDVENKMSILNLKWKLNSETASLCYSFPFPDWRRVARWNIMPINCKMGGFYFTTHQCPVKISKYLHTDFYVVFFDKISI